MARSGRRRSTRAKSCNSDLEKPSSHKDVLLSSVTVAGGNNEHTQIPRRLKAEMDSSGNLDLKKPSSYKDVLLSSVTVAGGNNEHTQIPRRLKAEMDSSGNLDLKKPSSHKDVLLSSVTVAGGNNEHTQIPRRLDDRCEWVKDIEFIKYVECVIWDSSDIDEALSGENVGNLAEKLTQILPSLDNDGRSENLITFDNKSLSSLINIISLKLKAKDKESLVADCYIRELLTRNIITARHDQELMRVVRISFPKLFPKRSRNLFKKAKGLFLQDFHKRGGDWKWLQKFWNLLILAYKFPEKASWDIFGKLMNLAFCKSRGKFTREKFEGLMKQVHQEAEFDETYQKYQTLKEMLPDDHLYLLMELGLDVFHYPFPYENFEKLVTYAQRLFPEEIPRERYTDSYRVMLAILVNQNSTLKGENLLAINKDKLDCLLDVAINYPWPNNIQSTVKNFGEQFFLLCKYVAELNRRFHPELEGPAMDAILESAHKGSLEICGKDVGPAVEVLYRNIRS